MKIYTKHGDGGQTSLAGGERVAKDDPRVEAYGTLDELCAHVGHLYDSIEMEDLREDLLAVQRYLMVAAAILSTDPAAPQAIKDKIPPMRPEYTAWLESRIDAMSATLPAIRFFSLPCGHPAVSQSHICRTVCRRAERAYVTASAGGEIAPEVGIFLNRLSDYLYVAGRQITMHLGVQERHWIPGA